MLFGSMAIIPSCTVFTLYYYHIKRAFEIELTRKTSNDIKIKSEANSGQCVYVQVQLSSVCISCTSMRAMQRQRYKSVQITYVPQDMHAYRVYLIHKSLLVCVCECVARICDLIISPVETLKRENLNKSNWRKRYALKPWSCTVCAHC